MKACPSLGRPPATIFVLKPSSFGDVIHTLPAVARLREAWPAARIAWLVNREWAPLLNGNALVDEVVVFPRQEFRGWRGLLRFRQWCRETIMTRRPDLALDFQGLLRTAIIGRLLRPGCFVGLRDAREGARWCYDIAVKVPPTAIHAVDRYLALSAYILSPRDEQSVLPGNASIAFPLPPGQPPNASESLRDDFIVIHPFARGADKSMSADELRALCTALAPRQVIVVGQWRGDALVLPDNARNLVNRTALDELIWILRRAAYVVSVDSGPAHLAAALGRPLVAIHTWSDPREVGPYRSDAWVLQGESLTQVRDLPRHATKKAAERGPGVLSTRATAEIRRLITSP